MYFKCHIFIFHIEKLETNVYFSDMFMSKSPVVKYSPLSFSKIQFCGYPSFKWDLVGCLGLNTKKNEKKTVTIL